MNPWIDTILRWIGGFTVLCYLIVFAAWVFGVKVPKDDEKVVFIDVVKVDVEEEDYR